MLDNKMVEGKLTGMHNEDIMIRVDKTKFTYLASPDVKKQIAEDDLLLSPVRVKVEGRRITEIAPIEAVTKNLFSA
jgi:hypothetical protein